MLTSLRIVQHIINNESINIRFHHHPLNRFTVFDGREAMISTNRKITSEDTSALWTTDTNLIGVLKGYFEIAWSESEDLKTNNTADLIACKTC